MLKFITSIRNMDFSMTKFNVSYADRNYRLVLKLFVIEPFKYFLRKYKNVILRNKFHCKPVFSSIPKLAENKFQVFPSFKCTETYYFKRVFKNKVKGLNLLIKNIKCICR